MAQLDDLSLSPRTQRVEGVKFYKLSSELHMHVMHLGLLPHTYKNKHKVLIKLGKYMT